MSKYERTVENLSFDFRTGRPTAISGHKTGEAQRATCSAINAARTSGILEAAQSYAPGEQVPVDVWTNSFERALNDWETPLIELSNLGLNYDNEGFLNSSYLTPLKSGAEAEPYWDEEYGVVYKLFNLRNTGALGKKLVLDRMTEDEEFQIDFRDADLRHTLTKLSVLNDAGALATEIVGLADSGDYLVAKQPLATPFKDFKDDLRTAISAIRAIVPSRGGFRQNVAIISLNGRPWVVGDLHDRNIMRDSFGRPCIIDALIGAITPAAMSQMSWLREAVADAAIFRKTGKKPSYDLFDEIDDSEL
ncbi:hypothetical protein ACFSSA_03565 [Luteolibacter algae]|uniref:Uncharacterized protein n=1 Tax=Luteolibacter algae TaxID=454151 RepID=A0ABW5D5P0_9BACT